MTQRREFLVSTLLGGLGTIIYTFLMAVIISCGGKEPESKPEITKFTYFMELIDTKGDCNFYVVKFQTDTGMIGTVAYTCHCLKESCSISAH